MSDLAQWLRTLGLEQYAAVLAANDVDLEVLPSLSDRDLEGLGLSLGHRRKLMAAAARLLAPAAPEPTPVPVAERPAGQGERRQVTVLFSDLVGSTELSTRLDPEDMGQLIRCYQDACAGVVTRFDGFVAKFMGDGLLAYFGYPQAYEDAAAHAVRAGLAIINAVNRITAPDGTALRARLGVATGLVVVGEIVGTGPAQEQTIVGDTPNLAARLQALAEPNTVLINAVTRQLIGEAFDYAPLGEHALKGIDQKVPVWRVLQERAGLSRFDAARATSLGPVVGRDKEIDLVLALWRKAADGRGQMVLLSGEGGIGKSRLVETLRERIGDAPHVRIRLQCSPYHRNTALYPLIQHLEHAASFAADDSPQQRREKLMSLFARDGGASPRTVSLLSRLLDVPDDKHAPPLDLTPTQQKTETLTALLDHLLKIAQGVPVFFHLEDAHWIDPTTQELIDRLVAWIDQARLFAIVTHRPEFAPPWAGRPSVTPVAFHRLDHEHCLAIVHALVPQVTIPPALVEEIIRRSDGVPLYLEELTRAVVESGLTRPMAVPATLQDSLMARLDRLGPVKDVAQIASVIGREFTRALLAEVTPTDGTIAAALATLVDAGLVLPQGRPADGRYAFKHALVQEAAYENLLRSRRQALHEKIARTLEARFPTIASHEPELVARHYSRAGLPDLASRYWERAADAAIARSAYTEAVANFEAGLAEVRRLPDSPARTTQLRDLLLKLGPAQTVIKGVNSDEMVATFTEAHELARRLGEGPELFKAAWGLWNHAALSTRFDVATERATELVALSQRLDDDDLLLEAYHCQWSTAHHRGDAAIAVQFGREGTQRYDPARHAHFAAVYGGHDAGVCAYTVGAVDLALTGQTDQARQSAAAGIALAERLDQPASLVHGLYLSAVAYHVIGDLSASRAAVERLDQIAQKFDFPPPRLLGAFLAAALRSQTGDPTGGADTMESLMDQKVIQGSHPFYHAALLAGALLQAGRLEAVRGLLDPKLAEARGSSIGLYVPEIWRLKGEMLLAESANNRDEAEHCLTQAMTIAERQGARLLQLRAATRFASLLAECGRRGEARALLQPLHARYVAGGDTPDGAAAARLLVDIA